MLKVASLASMDFQVVHWHAVGIGATDALLFFPKR
jgi:hypothetical protein